MSTKSKAAHIASLKANLSELEHPSTPDSVLLEYFGYKIKGAISIISRRQSLSAQVLSELVVHGNVNQTALAADHPQLTSDSILLLAARHGIFVQDSPRPVDAFTTAPLWLEFELYGKLAKHPNTPDALRVALQKEVERINSTGDGRRKHLNA